MDKEKLDDFISRQRSRYKSYEEVKAMLRIKSQLDKAMQFNMRIIARGKWEILEDYKDGTSRCRCTSCKNTYRLSKQTIYGFSFCPKCGSYNREYDGYKSNKWIEGFKNPAEVLDKDKLNRLFESDNSQ